MSAEGVFVAGGTVQAGRGIYLERKADAELLDCCRQGIFAYVLTPRQLGKSSLMVRTGERLREEGIKTVSIDLTMLGAGATAEQWYLGLVYEVHDQLGLDFDLHRWWDAHSRLSVAQRFALFWSEVVLPSVRERIVIFVDEIDSTLSLGAFTDDFFAEVRAFYNARAIDPEFQRLSFVMLGVATPGDLIRDPHRTPFNIGRRIDLDDFSIEEALPLAGPLDATIEAPRLLAWVFEWTHGHPYLTQRVLAAINAQSQLPTTRSAIKQVVRDVFFGERSAQDNNLQFVRDMLTKRSPTGYTDESLRLYGDIRRGRPVSDEEQSIPKNHLKLSGIVRVNDDRLCVRNRIYRKAFDSNWVKQHTPRSDLMLLLRKIALPAATIVVLALGAIAYFVEVNRRLREQASALSLRAEVERQKVLSESELRKKDHERSRLEKLADAEREKTERELDFVKTKASVAQARLEENDRFLKGDGMLDELRREKNANQWDLQRAEAVLDTLASYHYKKGDLEKLIQILKKNQDLVPEKYGVDTTALSVLPKVSASEEWPFVVEYSPRSGIETSEFIYHWRSLASQATAMWGIPFPMRLKLIADDNLPNDEFRLKAPMAKPSSDDRMPRDGLVVRLRTAASEVVVSKPDHPRLLAEFFDKCKLRQITQLRRGGQWWLVPRWSQPVWKVAGHNSFHREGAMALVIANEVLDKPEMALSQDMVGFLLGRLSVRWPRTVEEALAARGLDGLTADLAHLVGPPNENPLVYLEYVLDSLANLPSSMGPAAAADQTSHDMNNLVRYMPARLPGRRPSGPTDVTQLKVGWRPMYEESASSLANPRGEVRVYVAERFDPLLFVRDGFTPELKETLEEAKSRFFRRFGFRPPSVSFDYERIDGFRIEAANQSSHAEESQPVKVRPEELLSKLGRHLDHTYANFRTWWLTPDKVYGLKQGLPKEVRQWLDARYSLTDLKLILRAAIEVTEYEKAMFAAGVDHLPNEVPSSLTLEHLDWLLRALAFYEASGQPRDPTEMGSFLRSLQAARLAGRGASSSGTSPPALSAAVRLLLDGKIDGAMAAFRAIPAVGLPRVRAEFVEAYAAAVLPTNQLASVAEKCSLPEPGRVASANGPTMELRYQVEQFLQNPKSSVSEKERRRLELCLMVNYVRARHLQKLELTRTKLVTDPRADQWTPTEHYLYSYLLLEAHGMSMARPRALDAIGQHLKEAFDRLEERPAEHAFEELLARYKEIVRAPAWYIDLLSSLPPRQPHSFWIPYRLGERLAIARTPEQLRMSQRMLATAETHLDSLTPEERPRVAAWLKSSRIDAAIVGLDYQQGARRGDDYRDVVSRLRDLIDSQVEDKEGWPTRGGAFDRLVSAHYAAGTIDDVARTISEWRRVLPGSQEANRHQIIMLLARRQIEEAATEAQRALDKEVGDDGDALAKVLKRDAWEQALCIAAIVGPIAGTGNYEHNVRQFLNETQHSNRDFGRLLLYWRLMVSGKTQEARDLITTRMKEIKPESWSVRMAQQDSTVWGEQLVAYFAGQRTREQIFAPVLTVEAFQASPLAGIGLDFDSVRIDAFFYDALLEGTTGDPSTRYQRQRKGLETVSRIGKINYFETHLARNLLERPALSR
jgi:hypothetical protein